MSFGEIGFRVSTSLRGRARGLHSCSGCTPQRARTIVTVYIEALKKKCLTCARIFMYIHAHMIRFVVSPVLSEYIYMNDMRASNSTADFVHRILHSNCVSVKEIKCMHFLAYVSQTIYKNAFYK